MSDNASENPLVSVVLPTYKRAHVLPIAIRSVLAQTFTNLELIVVDDNSPDATRDVVASFADPRIRYVRNDPNLKLPRALNRGFSLSRGRYLTWTSDDNLYGADAIRRMVDAIERDQCDFVYADYYQFTDLDVDGEPLAARHQKLPHKVQLERGNHIGACFMYSRAVYEAVGDYDPDLFLVEDYDYFMRIAKRFRVTHIAEPLYYFRRHDDALFVSRFCEVKASDFLVRYKNGLLSEDDVLEGVVALLLRNVDALHSPVLRHSYLAVRDRSYKLTKLHETLLAAYLRRRLRGGIAKILDDYRSKGVGFATTKDTLCGLIKKQGAIAYNDARLQ
jgi:glycosyltransferase involved in cell wall biosynthesis